MADKIYTDETEKKKDIAKEIDKKYDKLELVCPYCNSSRYKETKDVKRGNTKRISNICSSCNKDWVEIYERTDIELNREHIPAELAMAQQVFE